MAQSATAQKSASNELRATHFHLGNFPGLIIVIKVTLTSPL